MMQLCGILILLLQGFEVSEAVKLEVGIHGRQEVYPSSDWYTGWNSA